MLDLSAYECALPKLVAAFAARDYVPPHASPSQLSSPYYLVDGDLDLDELPFATGTLVVTGSLSVSGVTDLQRDGRPIANVIVFGDCRLQNAYVDAFLVVEGTLAARTLVADSTWDGAIFVSGDLVAEVVVIKDIGLDVDGARHVDVVADCEDEAAAKKALPKLFRDGEVDARGFFASLGVKPAAKKVAAKKKPAAPKRPAPKKPAAKSKKAASKKPAAKTSASKSKKPARNVKRR